MAVEGLVVENLHACVDKGVVAGLKMVLSVIEYAQVVSRLRCLYLVNQGGAHPYMVVPRGR